MRFRTNVHRDVAAANVVFDCGEQIAFDAPHFVQVLEEMLRSGSVFRAGQTIQIGWSVLRFVPTESPATLSLEELDFTGTAAHFRPEVTGTLLSLRRQRAVLESFEMVEQMQFPSMQDRAIRCTRFRRGEACFLSRSQDGQWFFGCTDEDHTHQDVSQLVPDSLYAVACSFPATIDFLSMPPGCIVTLDEDGALLEAFDPSGGPLQLTPGSYLHEKRERGI